MKKRVVLFLVVLLALSTTLVYAAPQRIISLAPSVTENLFSLGVGDKVIGVTSWCTFPEEAQTRTIIGDTFNLNLELILSLEPDLVVADASLTPGHIETLQGFNIPVFIVDPTTVAEVEESLRLMGEAVGAKEQGEEVAAAMAARFEELVSGIQRTHKTRVFIEVWNAPLMTAGPGSFMDELIVLAGGENIAFDATTPWPTFSEEVVIERDPEVVVLTCYNLDEALSRPAWQITSAMKNGHIYEVNPDLYSRTTIRLLDALAELITILDAVEQ